MANSVPWLEAALTAAANRVSFADRFKPRGIVQRVGDGVALVAGLDDVRFEEMLTFDSGAFGMAYDLRADAVGAILLAGAERVHAGDGVVGSGDLPDLQVGPRHSDACSILWGTRWMKATAVACLSSTAVSCGPGALRASQCRANAVDRCLGHRCGYPDWPRAAELIIGDRNVGKTALALDIVVAQHREMWPASTWSLANRCRACWRCEKRSNVPDGSPTRRSSLRTLQRVGNAILGAVCRGVRRRVVP